MHMKTSDYHVPAWVYVGRGVMVWICILTILAATPVIPAVIMLATDHPETSERIVRTIQTSAFTFMILSGAATVFVGALCIVLARAVRAIVRH